MSKPTKDPGFITESRIFLRDLHDRIANDGQSHDLFLDQFNHAVSEAGSRFKGAARDQFFSVAQNEFGFTGIRLCGAIRPIDGESRCNREPHSLKDQHIASVLDASGKRHVRYTWSAAGQETCPVCQCAIDGKSQACNHAAANINEKQKTC